MACFFGGFHIGLSGPLIPYLRILPQIWPWCRITATAIQSHNELSGRGGGVEGGGVEGGVWLWIACAHGRAVKSQAIFSWADQRALGRQITGRGGNISPYDDIRGSFQIDSSGLSYSQRQRTISSARFGLISIPNHWGMIGRLVDLILNVHAIGPFKRTTSYKMRHPFLRCITWSHSCSWSWLNKLIK